MIAKNNNQHEPEPPEKNGGFGGGTENSEEYPLAHKNEMARLERRSVHWDTRQEGRDAIIRRQAKTAIDPKTPLREARLSGEFIRKCDEYEANRLRHDPGIVINVNGEDGNGNANIAPGELIRRAAIDDPELLEFIRSRDLATDSKPRIVCADGQQRAMENGSPSRGTGSTTDANSSG